MFGKMKKTLFIACLAIVVGIFSVGMGECATTATIGDQNSSGNFRVTVDTDGIVTFASDTAIKFPYQSGTTNDTLTAADSGRTYVITSGATSAAAIKLPAAAVGMEFPIVSATTKQVFVVPNGTDIINYASLSAGDSLGNSSAAKGDSITLFCVTANEWSVKGLVGTWADANGYGD